MSAGDALGEREAYLRRCEAFEREHGWRVLGWGTYCPDCWIGQQPRRRCKAAGHPPWGHGPPGDHVRRALGPGGVQGFLSQPYDAAHAPALAEWCREHGCRWEVLPGEAPYGHGTVPVLIAPEGPGL